MWPSSRSGRVMGSPRLLTTCFFSGENKMRVSKAVFLTSVLALLLAAGTFSFGQTATEAGAAAQQVQPPTPNPATVVPGQQTAQPPAAAPQTQTAPPAGPAATSAQTPEGGPAP